MTRFMTESERAQLTRKPAMLSEAAVVHQTDERFDQMLGAGADLLTFWPSSLGSLHAEVLRARNRGEQDIEFLALDVTTGFYYLVNTEGHSYARYVGRSTIEEDGT